MRKQEVKSARCREYVHQMTPELGAYFANHCYKDGSLYVLFAGYIRKDEDTTWVCVHDQMPELSVLCLQMILTYHSEVVKRSEYRHQMLKILSLEPEMSANRLASMIHQPVSWIVAMLGVNEKLNLLTMPLASAYALSKWPSPPEELMQKAQRMKAAEFIPYFYERLREFRESQRKKRA